MIVCIQCAMEALLRNEPYDGEASDDARQHIARVHPDPAVTAARRRELERLVREKIAGNGSPAS